MSKPLLPKAEASSLLESAKKYENKNDANRLKNLNKHLRVQVDCRQRTTMNARKALIDEGLGFQPIWFFLDLFIYYAHHPTKRRQLGEKF